MGLKRGLYRNFILLSSSCEPTYMGLKHCCCCCCSACSIKLRAYLYGIETGYSAEKNLKKIQLRAYLYGIETWSQYLKFQKNFNLRAYLYGIETSLCR